MHPAKRGRERQLHQVDRRLQRDRQRQRRHIRVFAGTSQQQRAQRPRHQHEHPAEQAAAERQPQRLPTQRPRRVRLARLRRVGGTRSPRHQQPLHRGDQVLHRLHHDGLGEPQPRHLDRREAYGDQEVDRQHVHLTDDPGGGEPSRQVPGRDDPTARTAAPRGDPGAYQVGRGTGGGAEPPQGEQPARGDPAARDQRDHRQALHRDPDQVDHQSAVRTPRRQVTAPCGVVQHDQRYERRDPDQVAKIGHRPPQDHEQAGPGDSGRGRGGEPVAYQRVSPVVVVAGPERDQYVTDERPVEVHREIPDAERQHQLAGLMPVGQQHQTEQRGRRVGGGDDDLVQQPSADPPEVDQPALSPEVVPPA